MLCTYILPRLHRTCLNKAHSKNVPFCTRHLVHAPRAFVAEQSDECGVCLESVDMTLVPCGHPVHVSCVVMSGKASCPICRSDVALTRSQLKSLRARRRVLAMTTTSPLPLRRRSRTSRARDNPVVLVYRHISDPDHVRIFFLPRPGLLADAFLASSRSDGLAVQGVSESSSSV